MRALISGQAGVAVMLDGDCAVSIDVENSRPVSRDPDEWPHLLEGADDAYELNDVSEGQVATELDLAWRKDRSLHLALIFLDGDTEKETRKECAELLEERVADDNVLKHIVNRLHVAPLPATADLKGAVGIATKRHPRVAAILEGLSRKQEAIALSRQAWDLLPPDLFGSALAKESFGFKAVEQGLFAAMSSGSEIDLTCYSRADREVVRRWRREIKSLEGSVGARRLNAGGDEETTVGPSLAGKKKVSYRVIAKAAACLAVAVVVTVFLINTRPVEASSIVRLGPSASSFQVVEAPLTGLQWELYGRSFIPVFLRSASKKDAERLFVSGEVDARAGRSENAATAFRKSNASFPTIAARLNEAVALLNSSKLVQAEGLLKSTLRDAEQPASKLMKAAILTNLGHIYRTEGRFDDADQAYSAALEIDRASEYKAGEAADLNNLALVLSDRGRNVKGLEGFRKALSVAKEAAADSVAADSHVNIGLTLSSFGRSREAAENFKSAAAYYERQGSPLGQAYYNLAYGQYMYGFDISARFYGSTASKELDQMLLYSSHARDLYRSVSNKSGEALALLAMGATLRAKAAESRDALDKYEKALRLTEEIGDVPGQEVALREIGSWYFGVKEYELAIQNYEPALDIARRIGNYGGQCVALEELGHIMAVTGKPNEALKYYDQAVGVSLTSGDAFMQAVAYDDLGFLLYKIFQKNTEALEALEHAYDLYSEVDSPLRDGTRGLIDRVKKSIPPDQLGRGHVSQPQVPQ